MYFGVVAMVCWLVVRGSDGSGAASWADCCVFVLARTMRIILIVIFYTYVVYAPPPIIRERPFLGSNITSVKASANYAQSLLFVHSLVPCHYLIMML